MHNLILCAVFKNESHILSEWINHYLNRGVDHIYLVNDNSTDNFIEVLEKYKDKITLFHNDIITKNVGRQIQIYNKYFLPILHTSTWAMILDLDEFLYSPQNKDLKYILNKYDSYSQLKIDWLHFASNGHELQPACVVSGFTKRANYDSNNEFQAYKTIFKTKDLISLDIHNHSVNGSTLHLAFNDSNIPDLVINHYNLQSLDFFMNVKSTRGDINNWFDSIKKLRDINLFKEYNRNDLEDLGLFKQNTYNPLEKVSEDGVTLVITSCNRPELLKRTLESFVRMNTYPIKKTFLIDDSGKVGCNEDAIITYKELLNITSLYNDKNIGQVESIDKVYSYVRTKWIFHCEEDWVFLKPGFIEKSMKVFNDNPSEKIYTVWLRPHNSTSGHPIIHDNLNRGYYMMKPDFSYVSDGITYTWGGITFNPGLRKTTDCLLHHPYSLTCDKMIAHGKEYVGEYIINKKYVDSGYFAYILDDPNGHVDHIGWNDHIKRFWD